MADKEALSVGDGQSTEVLLALSGLGVPGVRHVSAQDASGFATLGCDGNEVVQPFPRSPKLQKKIAKAAQPSQEQLSRRMEELQTEKSKTEAHIQSLKKRKANLSRSTDAMKQKVRERFEGMRVTLMQDEQAVLDSLELDLRKTRSRLDQVVKSWKQHLDQVSKSIGSTQKALSESPEADGEDQSENLSSKKPDASEEEIRLNEERFERLLKTLSSISRGLKAQLQRKELLLDWLPIVIDSKTCHGQLAGTSKGRGLSFSDSAHSALEHPLQFDKVFCALGSSPVATGRSYWEVDVRCCGAWAVGVAYGTLERKGRDKGAKLGRNRNSWCVELRNGQLSAWHNDRHVACHGVGQALPGRVGVRVDYDRGQLTFYDAESMAVLQRFSAAVTSVFDRAHHQFTEPLYPAVRFLRPPEDQAWPNHLQLCHPNAP